MNNAKFLYLSQMLALVCVLAISSTVLSQQSPRPTRAQITSALRRYSHEPSVERVVQAAIKASDSDPDRAQSLASSARTAGWLPTVKLGLLRGLARDQSAHQTLDEDRTTLSTDDDLRLEASLTFHFQRLIFDHNEVAIAREQRALEQARSELISNIIQLYFERRRLQLERDLASQPDLGRETRILELESLLNVFTDGEFRRMMSKSK